MATLFQEEDAMKRSAMHGLLAAGFAAAMGFGAVQALAAPAAEARAACQPDVCAERCAREGLTGICSGRGCYCR
jgi:hypothetical protein